MAVVRIDIDLMNKSIRQVDTAIDTACDCGWRLGDNLGAVLLSALGLSDWKSGGGAVAELRDVKVTLVRVRDKAVEVNAYGVGRSLSIPREDLAYPEHTIVEFEENPDVSLDDAKMAVDWVNSGIHADGEIPPDVLRVLQAGSGDTAFRLFLSSHVSAGQLTSLIDAMDLAFAASMDKDSSHWRDKASAAKFEKDYSSLLDALAGIYSGAVNDLPRGGHQRPLIIEGFENVIRMCPVHDPDGALLSLLIARGDWPNDFLDAMKSAIEDTEGDLGAFYWQPWWGLNSDYPRVIVDPGRRGIDGSPIVAGDPMYGLWMSAAIYNIDWFMGEVSCFL